MDNFLQEINPKLQRERGGEGRKESMPLVSPVKLLRTAEVKTQIKAAVALERTYHIGSK